MHVAELLPAYYLLILNCAAAKLKGASMKNGNR